eukprot:6000582-Pyramimonas_sp.AAC.1
MESHRLRLGLTAGGKDAVLKAHLSGAISFWGVQLGSIQREMEWELGMEFGPFLLWGQCWIENVAELPPPPLPSPPPLPRRSPPPPSPPPIP